MREVDRWAGPFSSETRDRAVDALEGGLVVFLPSLPFKIEERERCLLSPSVADGKAKNVSLDPASGAVKGAAVDADQAALQAMLERFASDATRLVTELFPAYAAGLERARTSYRPVEIVGAQLFSAEGRQAAARGRLSFDAHPRPTHPASLHQYRARGSCAHLARRRTVPGLRTQVPALVAATNPLAAWFFAAVGATKGRRSAYDQLMLSLHDGAKRDAAYQKGSPQVEIAFPPGTSWLCYTDQVLHAALAGQYALEQTFHLDLASMVDAARSPLKVLEGLAGRPLAS